MHLRQCVLVRNHDDDRVAVDRCTFTVLACVTVVGMQQGNEQDATGVVVRIIDDVKCCRRGRARRIRRWPQARNGPRDTAQTKQGPAPGRGRVVANGRSGPVLARW